MPSTGGKLPDFIDSPQHRSSAWRRRRIIFLTALALGVFLSGRVGLSYWVDFLWFQSIGYGEVFWKSIGLQVADFVFFAGTTFLILYGAFSAIRRSHEAHLPWAHAIVIAGERITLPVQPVLRVISLCISIVIACVTALGLMTDWPLLALFWYAPRATGAVADPIFGKPLNFFLFTLPAWQIINNWLLTLAIAICAVAVLFLIITSGARSLTKRQITHAPSPWRGLSITVAFLLLVLAMNVYVERFQLLLEHHTIFDGITYTDAHVTIYGLLIVCAALVLGAMIAAYSAVRHSGGRWIVAAILPALVSYGVLAMVGWYVGSFIVKPNELVREEPFITHNIEMTRQAYGLNHFAQLEFPAETNVDAADPANNQPTLQNIRLWDWHALQDTLRQVQEIRTYYDFPDIDIDRYKIDGTTRQVMLAARELNVEKLPESSRNWINEKLIYTHGYGVTMNPVNGFTAEGLPTLLLSNMPVQSTVAGLNVTHPEIYFGELTDTDVYVKTRQQEFDYPQGQNNNLTSYQGTGGIVLGGFLRRVILAIDRGDLGKLPFSDDVNAQSRLLMRRNIRERVAAVAPFLTLDRDPYVVVGDDGRLSWIMDAFTVSEQLSVFDPLRSRRAVGQLHAKQRQGSCRCLYRGYDALRLRPRRSDSCHVSAHLPQPFQGWRRDAGRPAQACPLPRGFVQDAVGSLRSLPYDESAGLLQP